MKEGGHVSLYIADFRSLVSRIGDWGEGALIHHFRKGLPFRILDLGERSTQEPQMVVHTSRISSPNNRNITPTQNEHSVFTPESNLNSDALWLQMSQFSEKTEKQFAELQESHERIKTLTASMEKIVKTLEEGLDQLSKASEETNKKLN
ncbi:hypothetical protein O181_011894 [Austropuccinia psidii MF-1]|uniref:Uncharacterized protein n=1 Tax=Austropuccinia psidii MF-1 TaxID=1389203 RepID=A0A9Q3GMB3_9BASI|nr:hypothetical protein [Austropuccinia psidii MF-1]